MSACPLTLPHAPSTSGSPAPPWGVLSGPAPPTLADEGSVGYRAASHRGADETSFPLAPATTSMFPPIAADSSTSGGPRPCWPSCKPHDPGLAHPSSGDYFLARALTEPNNAQSPAVVLDRLGAPRTGDFRFSVSLMRTDQNARPGVSYAMRVFALPSRSSALRQSKFGSVALSLIFLTG